MSVYKQIDKIVEESKTLSIDQLDELIYSLEQQSGLRKAIVNGELKRITLILDTNDDDRADRIMWNVGCSLLNVTECYEYYYEPIELDERHEGYKVVFGVLVRNDEIMTKVNETVREYTDRVLSRNGYCFTKENAMKRLQQGAWQTKRKKRVCF